MPWRLSRTVLAWRYCSQPVNCDSLRYRSYGKNRDSSLERSAVAALGANARRRELDNFKRQECARRFLQMTPEEQCQLLPGFEVYLRDTEAREGADQGPGDEGADEPPCVEAAAPENAAQAACDEGADEPPCAQPFVAEIPERKRKRRKLTAVLASRNWQKLGRPRKAFASKRRSAKEDAVTQVLAVIARHCATTEDVATLLSRVLKRLLAIFAGLSTALHAHGITVTCRCSFFQAFLHTLCQHAGFCKDSASKVALAESAVAAGYRCRRLANKDGLEISRRSWRAAHHTQQVSDATLPKRGRSSILQDEAAQELVAKLAKENSRDSSKLMMIRKRGQDDPQPILVRHWTKYPHQVYLQTFALMERMSYSTFLRMLKQCCPEVKVGQSLTDFCDHCHTYRSVILKNLDICSAAVTFSGCRSKILVSVSGSVCLCESSLTTQENAHMHCPSAAEAHCALPAVLSALH